MTSLPLGVAVPLAHALTHRLLSTAGIRVLFIKGPVAQAQGLREAKTSGDVDVLCDPADLAAATDLLIGAGWQPHDGNAADSAAVGAHAATFAIPGWPCTVDLHGHFPGLLAPPAEVFAALWARHTEIELAHQAIPAPDRVDHAVILGVNSLRTLRPVQTGGPDGAFAVAVAALKGGDRDEIREAARALGALEPLRESLIEAGIDPGPPDPRYAREFAIWEVRREHPSDPGVQWLTRWQAAAWRDRPQLLYRAVWDVSLDASRTPAEWAQAPAWQRGQARARRLGRGLSRIPGAGRTLWSARRRAR